MVQGRDVYILVSNSPIASFTLICRAGLKYQNVGRNCGISFFFSWPTLSLMNDMLEQ